MFSRKKNKILCVYVISAIVSLAAGSNASAGGDDRSPAPQEYRLSCNTEGYYFARSPAYHGTETRPRAYSYASYGGAEGMRATAIEMINTAIMRDKYNRASYQKTLNALKKAHLAEGGGDCGSWVNASVGGRQGSVYPVAQADPRSQTIHLCQPANPTTLVHEATHLTGELDECITERRTKMIELAAGWCLFPIAMYDLPCKLDAEFDMRDIYGDYGDNWQYHHDDGRHNR